MQLTLKTHPSGLSTSPPIPFLFTGTGLSLLSKAVPGSFINKQGSFRFQVWTHLRPFPQHTTAEAMCARWMGVPRTGGPTRGPHCPQDDPAFQNPKLQTTPMLNPLGLPPPQVLPGHPSVMTCTH